MQVLFLFIKKGSRTNPLNYRPVSLTSIVSKILEHIISHNINSFLDTNSLFTDTQHGFRKKHGCDTQLITTVTDLIDSFDKNLPTDVIVLDFSKAFDVVSHPKLLLKMKAIGIHPNTCQWTQNWLSNRTLSVTVNSCHSSDHLVKSSVPQSSVLGPLLFLIFINDMPTSVQQSTLRLFADDSLVYKQVTTQQDSSQLQNDLNSLVGWADKWQMKFNVSKCEHMLIQRQNSINV